MKKFFQLILIVAVVLVLPAFLAPIIYPWVQHKYPFERVLSRLVMLFGFAAVFCLFARDLSAFKRFGFVPMREWWRWLLLGLGLGIAILFALELFQTLMGAYDIGIRVKWNRIPERIGKFLVTALVIGTTEEFFFRGFIFVSLSRIMNWKWSFVLTNLFYALLHFFHGTKEVWVHPTFTDSFRVMIAWFSVLQNWPSILPAFFGLFFFGCILSYAFLKSGGLYFPIGIHAGAVFFLKIDVMFFGGKGNFPAWLMGTKDYYDGVMGWIFLAAFWLLLWIWLRKRSLAKGFFEKTEDAG